MSGFKVGDQYRTNELSLRPGGYTVIVQIGGRRFEYDKIKYPMRYISKVKRNPEVVDAWVKEESS